MFGTIKSAVELIEKWPTVGDRLYFVAGSLASLVAIVAIAEDERPSELMGELSDAIGVRPVARWLGTDAPPFLASQSLAVQEACLSGVSAFVAIMIVGTVTRAPFYPDPIYDVPRLVGSRATATTWILILVAAQQGSVRPVLDGLRHVAAQAVWWCIGTALVVGLLAFILHRFRLADVLAPLLGPIAGFGRAVASAVVIAFAAVAIVPLYVPLRVLFWLCALESQPRRAARIETDRMLAEDTRMSAGSLRTGTDGSTSLPAIPDGPITRPAETLTVRRREARVSGGIDKAIRLYKPQAERARRRGSRRTAAGATAQESTSHSSSISRKTINDQ